MLTKGEDPFLLVKRVFAVSFREGRCTVDVSKIEDMFCFLNGAKFAQVCSGKSRVEFGSRV